MLSSAICMKWQVTTITRWCLICAVWQSRGSLSRSPLRSIHWQTIGQPSAKLCNHLSVQNNFCAWNNTYTYYIFVTIMIDHSLISFLQSEDSFFHSVSLIFLVVPQFLHSKILSEEDVCLHGYKRMLHVVYDNNRTLHPFLSYYVYLIQPGPGDPPML